MNSPDANQQLMSLPETLAQADAMYQQTRFEEASNLYNQALVMLDRQGGDNAPEIAHVLQKLADSYHAINRFRESLPLYERLLSIGKQLLGPKHPDVIMLVFKIARTQELIGSFGDARSTYEQLIPLARSSLAPGHDLVKQIEARFNGLLERIDENKRAAQAWRESTVMRTSGAPAGSGELSGMPPLPASSSIGSAPPSSQPAAAAPSALEAAGVPPSSASAIPPSLMSAPGPNSIPPGMFKSPGAGGFNSLPQTSAPAPGTAGPSFPNTGASSPAHGQPNSFGNPQLQNPASNPSIGPGGLLVPSVPGSAPPPSNSPPPARPATSPLAALSNQIAASSQPGPGNFPNDSGVLSTSNGFERPMTQGGPGGLPPGMMQGGAPGAMPPGLMQGGAPGSMPPAMMQGGAPGSMPPGLMPGAPGAMPPGLMQGGAPGAMPPGLMQGGNPGGMPKTNSVGQAAGGMPQSAPGFNDGYPNMGGPKGGPGLFSGPASPSLSNNSSGPSLPVPPPTRSNPPTNNQPMSLLEGVFGNNPAGGSSQVQPSTGDPWSRGPMPPPTPSASDSAKIFIGSSPNVARSGAPPEVPKGPNLDPYLSHLANKVVGLKAQADLEEEAARKSSNKRIGTDSGWHDASVSIPPTTLTTSKRAVKASAQAQYDDDYDEENSTYVEDEVEYDRRSKKISRSASSRSAANKSEGMVSTVRAFKEYVIPAVMLIFLIVGGYQFMHENAAPVQLKTNPGAPVIPQAQPGGPVSTFTSPDGKIQLALSAGNKAVFGNGKTAMEAPYVVYDGEWSKVAMQAIDSLMECQFWFNEYTDVMRTENGINLYSQKSPDWTVLQKSKACMDTARIWWKARQQYPAQQKLVASTKEFIYGNPFTGETRPIAIQSVNDNVDLKGIFAVGGSLPGEKPFERGEIRAYAVRATADNQTGNGTAFYVRAADRNGQLFTSSDSGAKLFWGENKGKDESNFGKAIENRQVFRPEKPTKVWIARKQQLPIFVLYHSVPITVGIFSFLLYWRSMMVMPGQTMENSTNKVFRIISMLGVFLTFCSGAIQFWLWK